MQTTRFTSKILFFFALRMAICATSPQGLAGQIIFEEHFESYPSGLFTEAQARSGGWDPRIGFTEQRMNILEASFGKYISMVERVGEWGYWNGASKFRRWFAGQEEFFYGYKVKFDANFDWKKGGKLLSVSGGSPPGAGVDVDGSQGASVGFMWRPEILGQSTAPADRGILHAYTYHEGKTVTWGQEDVLEDGNGGRYLVEKNRWYKLVFRIKMNDQDVPNGIVQIWLDGVLRMDRRDFLFRTGTGSWKWDLFDFIYFFGGDGPAWSPDQESFVYVDSLIVAKDMASLTPLLNGNTTSPPGGGSGNIPPTADIAVSVSNGPVPLSVNFSGQGSTDPNNNIVDYHWDFGDGDTANGPLVAHTYTVAGTFTVSLRVTDRAGEFDIAKVIIQPGKVCGPILSSWQSQDIGAVGIPGSACYDSAAATFHMEASGADVWASDDQFHFVYQVWTGDGSVIARIRSLTQTHNYAKAGVMMREDLTNDSRHAMMVVNQNRRAFQYREIAGDITKPTSGSWENSYVSFPVWVKLTRLGGVITGYVSADGVNWEEANSYYLPMNQTLYIGIMHTSHDNTKLGTSSFDHVSIMHAVSEASCGQVPVLWQQDDVGNVGFQGGSCYNDSIDRYSLIASGTDIWDNADAFHYMHRPLQGDGEMIIRVVYIGYTHPYAKGGLMMRESLDEGSKHASVLINQDQKAMQYRKLTDGLTGPAAGWARAVPSSQIYFRLVRVGHVFAGFSSVDGRSWDYIHSEEILMNTIIQAGIASTSHDNSVVNISAFEGLSFEQRGAATLAQEEVNSVAGFSGRLVGEGVRLGWTSPNSFSRSFFTVERSIDGLIFETLQNIVGPGNAGTDDDYTYLDKNPARGKIIYRLRENNYNGTYGYAGVVEIDMDSLFHRSINVYPNPSKSRSVTLDLIGMELDLVYQISLLDAVGRVLYIRKPTSNSMLITFPEEIPDGVYFLRVEYGNTVIGKHIMLEEN